MPATTRDGREFKPSYLLSIDPATCIGCGRCYKVCGMNVLGLMGYTSEGEFVDPDDDEDEVEKKVMVVADEGACIGCNACARVCPANCQTHGAA